MSNNLCDCPLTNKEFWGSVKKKTNVSIFLDYKNYAYPLVYESEPLSFSLQLDSFMLT